MISQLTTAVAGLAISFNLSSATISGIISLTPDEKPDTTYSPPGIDADLPSHYIDKSLRTPNITLITPSPTPTSKVLVKADSLAESNQSPREIQPVPAPGDLDHWFTTYANAFRVNPDILKHIARCESGFNPNSQGGPYGGMFQYSASTWSSTRNAMGLDPNPELRYNAEESIKTSAWKISVGGIRAWPHCSRQFSTSQVAQ